MAKKLNLKEFLSDDTLDLSLNGLEDVPVKEIATIPKATSLDLSNNKLTLLSKSFATSLTHLIKLDLARNDLRELPKNFGCLVNLRHLDLYKNKIVTLPLSFANLKSLRWLDIKDNPLEPHWQHIVGPCLNAQDCKNAAKNVVSVASLMNEEISAEVQKSQARQKHLEENEIKEQTKKKEKQKEKKKRNRAAKLAAESDKKNIVENGSVAEIEEISPEIEKNDEIAVEIANQNSIWLKLRTVVFFSLWTILYSLFVLVLSLLVMKFTNEPIYNKFMSMLHRNLECMVAQLPGPVRVSWHKFNMRLVNNLKYVVKNIFTVWRISYKSIINVYEFLFSDPRMDRLFNIVINSILYLYISICQFVGWFFSIVTQIQIS